MTSETHPTAVQTAHHIEVINGLFECDCGQPFHSTMMALAHLNNAVDQAIRERDEAIRLLRERVEAEDRQCWFDHNQNCQEHMSWRGDGTCVVAEARAFLSNFPEEAPAVTYTEKERE